MPIMPASSIILIFITDRFCWRCGTAAAVGRLVRKVRAPTYLVQDIIIVIIRLHNQIIMFFWKSRGNVENFVLDDDNYLKADLPSAKERLLDLKNDSFRNYKNIS